jgi:heme exporter protein B
MRQLFSAIRKEMLLQWRTRAQILAIFIFGATALLLFSFAIGPNSSALRLHAPGFLWLGLLLSSTLALAESFQLETEQKGMEGLLLLPASPRALYYAKAIANAFQLSVLGAALIPVMVVLYDVRIGSIGTLFSIFGVIVLGAAGLSAPGTVYSAMASQARAKQTLLPLLLFPLVVPVLLAVVKATSLLIEGDAMGQLKSWVTLVTSFDLIYWSLCGLVFGRVVED